MFVGEALSLTLEAQPCLEGTRFQVGEAPEGLVATVPGLPCRLALAWTPLPGQETGDEPLEVGITASAPGGRQGRSNLGLFVWAPWEPSWDLPASLPLEAGQPFLRLIVVLDPAASALHLQMLEAPPWLELTRQSPGRFELSGTPPLDASGRVFAPRFVASGDFAVEGQTYEAWVLEGTLELLVLPALGAPAR